MATTKLGNTKSASRAINYAEKRAKEKSGLNCDVDYAKSAFKQEPYMVKKMGFKHIRLFSLLNLAK
ncbi:relaxase/mobilization nuclease domain-containing protein [Staphylococcus equorum]|nr:relaxase/mobilization nuclease domain-containing protein [Staphylococcus equorum]